MKPRTLLVVAVVWALALTAADWPQWRGPNRDDISQDKGLLKSWPAGGPPLLWTCTEAGLGYSGPAVVGDRLYAMGARGQTEYLYSLDTGSGKRLWSTAVGSLFSERRGNGPRDTPTVDGDRVYALGAQGDLVCAERRGGKKLWHVNLKRNLGGQLMSTWGYTESPLVDDKQVVCTPGGSRGTMAALDKKSGKVIWRSKELTDPASYASAVVGEVGGIRQYVQLTGNGVAGVAAKDGRLLWHYLKDTYRIAVIPTPIFHDGFVYVSAGYGAGCDLIRLVAEGHGEIKAEQVYANKVMVNHHGGVVLVGGYLYGYSEGKGWTCQDFRTGKAVWQEKRRLGKGSLTYADGHLYCYTEDGGTVVLVRASPEGWEEDGRFQIPRQTTRRAAMGKIWTHPVVANGRLYLRDQDLIFCYDVKNPASPAE